MKKRLSDIFIDKMIKDFRSVCIFLTNGVKLSGKIDSHDYEDGALILQRDGVNQLVYINSVSTIMPVENEGNK